MGLLWVQCLLYNLPLSLHCCIQYYSIHLVIFYGNYFFLILLIINDNPFQKDKLWHILRYISKIRMVSGAVDLPLAVSCVLVDFRNIFSNDNWLECLVWWKKTLWSFFFHSYLSHTATWVFHLLSSQHYFFHVKNFVLLHSKYMCWLFLMEPQCTS